MSVYYPYLRGKQYELILVRENARQMAASGIAPIIEPVKDSLRSLDRALEAVEESGAEAVVLANPEVGYHAGDASSIQALLRSEALRDAHSVAVGVSASARSNIAEIIRLCESFPERDLYLVHAGFTDGRLLSEAIDGVGNIAGHVFFEEHCGRLYRRHFPGGRRVLLRDGFERRTNREHPEIESFSDLHITYREEGATAFGDFLIVGDQYFESGGPAYAVAIHLTYIDSNRDDAMFIHHFVSDRKDTPTDPAGKFAEALQKLADEVARPETQLLITTAVEEFLALHERRHFPGLGYVKKLAMQHHIETLANYLTT